LTQPDTLTINLADYYQPHPGQQEYHDSPASKKYKEEGRRFGKSRSAFWEMMTSWFDSWETPADKSLVPPWHAWIVVPAFPQSHQVWTELLAFIPQKLIQNIKEDDKIIFLQGPPNRPWGMIELKSAHNPAALQTAGLDYLWVTEAQDVLDEAFEKLLPMLTSPGRQGKATYEGIPSLHSGHWFKRGCNAAQAGLKDAAYFHHTAFDNPLLTEAQLAEIESHRELLPDRAWRRMYLAEFNEDAGYFSGIESCIEGWLLREPIPGTTYIAGIDLGRKVDPTVIHIMDARERRVIFHQTWDGSAEWTHIIESVIKLARDWDITRLIVDATGMGGDMFVSQMAEANLPVEPFIISDNANRTGVRTYLLESLVVAIEQRNVTFPSIPSLLRQLRAFQYRRLPGGSFKAEAPPGEHDDEVFALALALTACDEPAGIPSVSAPSSYRSRYVPTMAEMMGGGLPSLVKRRAHVRTVQRVRERQEALDIE